MTACTAPDCTRDATAHGLCRSHYQQRRRGHPLTPLRERPADPLVRVSLRVPATVRAAVLADGDGARAALGTWALTQRGPRR